MDVAEYIKATGNFLKAEDVSKNPDALWIIRDGSEFITNKFGTERLHIPVSYQGDEYIFDTGKTNVKTIAEKLGNDTEKWKECAIKLETYKTKTSEGKITDAINVKEALTRPEYVN